MSSNLFERAVMIPNDVEEFQTEGERVFFRFLQSVAKPDSRYVVWYLPDVNGKEPDFLLTGDDVGLVVFEVKDRALNQIQEANPHQFLVGFGERPEPKKNPLHQAHDYLVSLKDKIQEDGLLVSRERIFFGNPKIPISCGVVFPNINKYEYTGKGLEKIVGSDSRGVTKRSGVAIRLSDPLDVNPVRNSSGALFLTG